MRHGHVFVNSFWSFGWSNRKEVLSIDEDKPSENSELPNFRCKPNTKATGSPQLTSNSIHGITHPSISIATLVSDFFSLVITRYYQVRSRPGGGIIFIGYGRFDIKGRYGRLHRMSYKGLPSNEQNRREKVKELDARDTLSKCENSSLGKRRNFVEKNGGAWGSEILEILSRSEDFLRYIYHHHTTEKKQRLVRDLQRRASLITRRLYGRTFDKRVREEDW